MRTRAATDTRFAPSAWSGFRAAGRIVSRHEMSAAIYRRPISAKDRSLDVHVSHLRKKLGPLGGLIRTIRGVGYLFCAEVGAHQESHP